MPTGHPQLRRRHIYGMITCPWGKHRSVAVSRCLQHVLTVEGYEVKEPTDLTAHLWDQNECTGQCKACTDDNDGSWRVSVLHKVWKAYSGKEFCWVVLAMRAVRTMLSFDKCLHDLIQIKTISKICHQNLFDDVWQSWAIWTNSDMCYGLMHFHRLQCRAKPPQQKNNNNKR